MTANILKLMIQNDRNKKFIAEFLIVESNASLGASWRNF